MSLSGGGDIVVEALRNDASKINGHAFDDGIEEMSLVSWNVLSM